MKRLKQVAAKALAQRGKISKDDLKDILEEKKQVIARSEILEFFESNSSQDDIGGLKCIKKMAKTKISSLFKRS